MPNDKAVEEQITVITTEEGCMKTKIRWVNVAVYSVIAASGITLWYAAYLLLKAKGVL